MTKSTNIVRKLEPKPSEKALTILREKAVSGEDRIHVLSIGTKWAIKKEGASRALRVLDTKDKALRLAKNLVRKGDAKSVISHKKDGSFIRIKSA